MSKEAFGMRVRRLRVQLGMSQDALARAMGVTRQTVYNIERGETSQPFGHTRTILAEALGVSEEYLVTGYDPSEDREEIPLDEHLRRRGLPEEDIAQVLRIVRLMEQEQRLLAPEVRSMVEKEREETEGIEGSSSEIGGAAH